MMNRVFFVLGTQVWEKSKWYGKCPAPKMKKHQQEIGYEAANRIDLSNDSNGDVWVNVFTYTHTYIYIYIHINIHKYIYTNMRVVRFVS